MTRLCESAGAAILLAFRLTGLGGDCPCAHCHLRAVGPSTFRKEPYAEAQAVVTFDGAVARPNAPGGSAPAGAGTGVR